MSVEKPLVGVVSDRRQVDAAHYFHMVGEKYLQALVDAADVYPVGLPSLANDLDVLEILGRLDGLFLPGSPSNLEPEHYRGRPIVDATADDGLIEAFVVADAPAFALGIQWHPEWQVHASEESTAIFRAFGDACRKYRAQHH